jgi:hypothetical protein
MGLSTGCPYLHGVVQPISKIQGLVLNALDCGERENVRGAALFSSAPKGDDALTPDTNWK